MEEIKKTLIKELIEIIQDNKPYQMVILNY